MLVGHSAQSLTHSRCSINDSCYFIIPGLNQLITLKIISRAVAMTLRRELLT